MKKYLLAPFLALLVALGPCASVAAAFVTNYNNLIDDHIFDNANSMNASQIDSFLNTFPSSCISSNNGFSAPDVTGYSPSAGFQFGSDVSAGTIIYHAAQAYGINPEVIIATLQKEEGLVKGDGSNIVRNGTDCGALALSASMGYDCPDNPVYTNYSGFELYSHNGVPVTSVNNTCVQRDKYVGFARQVIAGAWLLTFDRHRSEGQNNWYVNKSNWDNTDDLGFCYSGFDVAGGPYYLCPDQDSHANDPYVVHSGQYVIDSTVVTMTNGATAALYDYTPHLHGQDLFTSNFSDWFGPMTTVKLTGNPGAVSWGLGRIDIFTRGTDGGLWQKWYDTQAGGWQAWSSLDVPIASSPTVASWGSGRLDIFYADSSGGLGHYWYDTQAGGWQTAESLGQPSPNVTIVGNPGAVSWGSLRLDIFARGSDNSLWQKTYNGQGTGWQPWVKLGGWMVSSPSPTTWGPGRLDVFATGPAGDLEHFWYIDNVWHPAESLGMPSSSVTLSTGPGGASWSNGRLDVFSRGSDGVLWQKWFDATGWHSWERFTGVLESSPSISSWAPLRLDEFSTGPDSDLQHYWYGGYWGNWESLGQPVS